MAKKEKVVKEQKGLKATIKDLCKAFGDGAIIRVGDAKRISNVDRFSTGIFGIDRVLCGGLPRGRIIEAFGQESTGKSTLYLHAAAELQKNGEVVAVIDAENALDFDYVKKLSVNVDELLVSQPSCGEEGLEIADGLVGTGKVAMIIIDSVAALVPKVELEGQMGQAFMGLQSRLMSQALRKITGRIGKTKTTICFTNQLREKIGVVYGDPVFTPGGKALKFYSSIRLDMKKREPIKDGEDQIGHWAMVKAIKNKVGIPYKSCRLEMRYGRGFSRFGSLVDEACDLGVLKQKKGWMAFEGKSLANGREKTIKLLRDDEKLRKRIEEEAWKAVKK